MLRPVTIITGGKSYFAYKVAKKLIAKHRKTINKLGVENET